MANPAFPPQMQPGMQPMPARPSGIPVAGTMRKGTPKAVPVVVSAGLAVGVFCGLYFGLGTGKDNDAEAEGASTSKATGATGPKTAAAGTGEVSNFKSGEQPDAAPKVADGSGSAAAGSGSAAAGSGSATVAGTGTGSGSGATTGSGSATPAMATVELTFAITPPEANVTLDGEPVVDGKATISFTGNTKTIRLVAKASGYRSFDKKVTFTKDTAGEAIEIKMVKRSSSGTHTSGGDHDRDRDPPGGLIDL